MRRTTRWLSAAVLLVTLQGSLALAADTTSRGSARIVAFGDVHGGAAELRALLRTLALIDHQENWIGGATRLVSLGDLLDRGPDSRQVMDLLMKLEAQAPAAGGSVHLVLGNHELMNLTGDLRYVAPEEYAAFEADEDPAQRRSALNAHLQAQRNTEGTETSDIEIDAQDLERAFAAAHPPGFFAHRDAFLPDGHYGSWLLSKPQILVLEGNAFVHGGLSDHFATESIEQYNQAAPEQFRQLFQAGQALVAAGRIAPFQDLLTADPTDPEVALPDDFLKLQAAFTFSGEGPSWYRGTAACHPLIERTRFERVLAGNSLQRVVMGHTPTNPRIIQSRFGDRAILADTGMLERYYHGRPSAVVINGDTMETFTLEPDGAMRHQLGRTAVDQRTEAHAQFRESLALAVSGIGRLPEATTTSDDEFSVEVNGREYRGRFFADSRRQRQARLAAGELDRLLGLGLVAPTIHHEQGGRSGVVEVMPKNSLNEIERVAQKLQRPNWCRGTSDYQLMYALDALLGLDIRIGGSLNYDRVTWLMYLTGHEQAFSTSTRLPRYLEKTSVKLPVALARALASLDQNGLEDALGAYLGARQIRALLARRDLMLETWPVEE